MKVGHVILGARVALEDITWNPDVCDNFDGGHERRDQDESRGSLVKQVILVPPEEATTSVASFGNVCTFCGQNSKQYQFSKNVRKL